MAIPISLGYWMHQEGLQEDQGEPGGKLFWVVLGSPQVSWVPLAPLAPLAPTSDRTFQMQQKFKGFHEEVEKLAPKPQFPLFCSFFCIMVHFPWFPMARWCRIHVIKQNGKSHP